MTLKKQFSQQFLPLQFSQAGHSLLPHWAVQMLARRPNRLNPLSMLPKLKALSAKQPLVTWLKLGQALSRQLNAPP